TLDRAEALVTPFGAPAYDPHIYAQPIFLHPPLYPYALALARRLGGTEGAALLSAAMHGATIALVGMLGMTWAGPAVGPRAPLLAAIEPVSWLCGHRLWIDAMLAALVAGSVLAAVRALDAGRSRQFFGAGLLLGFACLAKLVAVLVLPGLVVAACLQPRGFARRPAMGYVAGPAHPRVPW